jgi:predicted DNA-binding protein with PD1-like motif
LLIRDCRQGKSLLARLDNGAEIIGQITDIVRMNKIEAATFYAIGALSRADLGYYDQKAHEYRVTPVEVPVEIASCSGNISLLDGQPFVHAHAVLSDYQSHVWAGHLVSGSIFAAEVYLQELSGPALSRTPDKITGLKLWTLE